MTALEAPPIEPPTLVERPLPRTSQRDRRRAAVTAPRLPVGRYLAIEDGGEVVVISLGDEAVRLGRSIAADVVLEDPSVSRRHAVIVRRGADAVILDDRSLNGVLVNGERVREAVLRDGDEIRLGQVAMRFRHVT